MSAWKEVRKKHNLHDFTNPFRYAEGVLLRMEPKEKAVLLIELLTTLERDFLGETSN